MFIDTATANNRSPRPRVIISPRATQYEYEDASTPLLDSFVGQDAPPSYLEATTPGLYASRLSEEQGARLLTSEAREARHAKLKEDKYRRKSLREQCLKRKCLKGVAAVSVVIIVAALLAAMVVAVSGGELPEVRNGVVILRQSTDGQ